MSEKQTVMFRSESNVTVGLALTVIDPSRVLSPVDLSFLLLVNSTLLFMQ